MIDYKVIGNRIKTARAETGMSQEQLAEKLNVTPEYCSRFENGKAKLNLERLSQVSVILNVPLENLICGVTVGSEEYLHDEIAEIIKSCSGKQTQAITEIAKIISKLDKE